jgi:hypothetical protein
MTAPILLFLLFGAAFGLLSFAHRHLFSEGPSRRDASAAPPGLKARLGWALLCSALWPLMLLTGLHTWCLPSRRRAQAARQTDGRPGGLR